MVLLALEDIAGQGNLDLGTAVPYLAGGSVHNLFHSGSHHIAGSESTPEGAALVRTSLAHTVGFDHTAALDMADAADAVAGEDIVDIADILDHLLRHNSLDLHLAAARRSLAVGSLGLGCNLDYSRTGLDLLRSRSCLELSAKVT